MKTKSPRHFSIWLTDKYIYVMLFLFPLFTGIEGYSNVTFSKYIFFVSATAFWLLALLVSSIMRVKSFHRLTLSASAILVLIYLLLCCVSAAFSPYKSSVLIGAGRFDGLITIFLCVMILINVAIFAKPKHSYIYAAAIAVTLNSAISVLQIFGFNPLGLFPNDYTFYDAGIHFSSTFLGTIGNADLFSAYLCLMLPMLAVFYIFETKRPAFLLPAVFLNAYCFFACNVSGGILALAVTAAVAAPIIITDGERLRRALEIAFVVALSAFLALSLKTSMSENGIIVGFSFSSLSKASLAVSFVIGVIRICMSKAKLRTRTLRICFISLLCVFFAASILTAYFWRGTEGTIYELSQVLHGNLQDSFGSSRILIWRKSLELIPESTLLGGGPGTLSLRLDIDFSRVVEETGKTLSTSVDNAHNDYLGILVNTGLLSLLAYIAAQLSSLFSAVKAAKSNRFVCCLACGLLCYWIQSFFGLGLFLVSPVMWLMWGLLLSNFVKERYDIPIDEPVSD